MRNAILIIVGLAAVSGCASPGTAEDFKWAIHCLKVVDRGAEFQMTVIASKSAEPSAEGGPTTAAIEGVECTYQILWTGGSSAPLRHRATTGEPIKIRARLVPGPATILVTSLNKDGLDVKVAEMAIEVK